jgi:uncharacterized protein
LRYVYLHGFASSPASGKAQFFRRKLAEEGIELEIPELDGGNFHELSISAMLGVMERLLRGEPAVLIGSSMGGYMAALYASLHEEIDRVVLLAPAFGFVQRWHLALGEPIMQLWRETGERTVLHYGRNEMATIGWQLISDGEQWPEEPSFGQPGLIFHGENDDIVPVDYSRAFVEKNPHVELVEKDSDHELKNVLEELWQESRAFLLQRPA